MAAYFFCLLEFLKMDNEVLIEGNICKSITGQEDENGNFIVEVEASNENLDLQNQRTLQSALDESKEYFLTNGVISDDIKESLLSCIDCIKDCNDRAEITLSFMSR